MSGKKIEVVELAYKAFQTEFKVSKSEAKRFALAKARIYELSAKARIRELGVHGLGGEIYEAPRSNPPLFFGLQTCEELASLGWLEVKMPGRAEELKRERAKEKDLAEFKGEVTKFSRTKTLLCNVLGERFAKPIKFERRNGATFISDGEVEVVLSNDLEKSLEGVDSLVRRACEKSGIRGLGPQTIRVLSLKALERSSAIDSYAKVRKCKDGRWAKFPGADVVFSALHAATVVLHYHIIEDSISYCQSHSLIPNRFSQGTNRSVCVVPFPFR